MLLQNTLFSKLRVIPLKSHRSNFHVKALSCSLVFSTNMRISPAILVVPGISADIVWRAYCNSSAAAFTPNVSRLKRFMRVPD